MVRYDGETFSGKPPVVSMLRKRAPGTRYEQQRNKVLSYNAHALNSYVNGDPIGRGNFQRQAEFELNYLRTSIPHSEERKEEVTRLQRIIDTTKQLGDEQ